MSFCRSRKTTCQVIEFNMFNMFYRPPKKLREGNVFTGVSVHCAEGYPSYQVPSGGRVYLGIGGHCGGRYTSYWNVFLSHILPQLKRGQHWIGNQRSLAPRHRTSQEKFILSNTKVMFKTKYLCFTLW